MNAEDGVRPVGLVSAALAPVGMIGGWTLAAALQRDFDPVRETISALAAGPAEHPWVMTAGLALTGVCHVVTATALRPAAPVGRLVLGAAGVATAAVAATPVTTWPQPHGVAAGVAFVGLSVWPLLASRRGRSGPLGRRTGAVATGVLSAMLVTFLLELQHATPADGAWTGVTERVLAGAQSLWPLAVVVGLRRDAARREAAR